MRTLSHSPTSVQTDDDDAPPTDAPVRLLQDEGLAFDNPQDMLRAMGCYEATQQAFTDFVREAIGDAPSSKRYESEFLEVVAKRANNPPSSFIPLAPLPSLLLTHAVRHRQ